jgi:hypothetical protein
MQPPEIRKAQPSEAVKFLDEGRGVDQTHLRVGLANALEQIAELTARVEQLEKRVAAAGAASASAQGTL